MKKRTVTIVASVILVSFSLFFLVGAGVVNFALGSIDFNADERLFEGARGGNLTRFYANASLDTGQYTPTEMETMTMDSSVKAFYPLSEISLYLKDGFVAVEDKDFYSHEGVNFRRTALAVFNHIFKLKNSFGASTITQQVIKNISGDNEQTARRKLLEMLRAMRIEDNHTKEEILELYLNIVPLGENVVGVGAGALHYFGKEPSELSSDEAAILIGITNAPTLYNPHSNPERCVEKRNTVLGEMKREGVITENEYTEAINRPLSVLPREETGGGVYSWFAETVIKDMSKDYAEAYGVSEQAARFILLTSGYEVYTTQRIELQRVLDGYFSDASNFPRECEDGLDFSMVISDSLSGELLAIVGSVGEKSENLIINHALEPHTPASTLKPLALYAPLIDRGVINWATVFDDVPLEFIDGARAYPVNSPNVYNGLTTVRDAIRTSKNTVAMRLYNILGAESIYTSLRDDFGFSLVRNRYDSRGGKITDLAPAPLALGQLTYGVGLRSLTEAYTVFPSNGIKNKGRSYLKVVDSNGYAVLENTEEAHRVFKPETAKIMNQLLMGVVDSGTAATITLGDTVDTAGKTGTSGGNLDKLFIGYTPYLTAGIRCSYNDSKTSVGAVAPSHLRIWDEVMVELHSLLIDGYGEPDRSFSVDGLIRSSYCADSGMLYSDKCSLDPRGNRLEYGYFTEDNKPRELCDVHVPIYYDTLTEGVAHEGCPREDLVVVSLLDIRERSFPIPVTVLDAEYVYRRVPRGTPLGDSYDTPYFSRTIPDGTYVGTGKRKKQFNHSCYLHD